MRKVFFVVTKPRATETEIKETERKDGWYDLYKTIFLKERPGNKTAKDNLLGRGIEIFEVADAAEITVTHNLTANDTVIFTSNEMLEIAVKFKEQHKAIHVRTTMP